MSDQVISWVVELNIKDGQSEAFVALMNEMVASTRNEPNTLIYEWFMSDDRQTVHIYKRYADSDAVLTHFGGFGTFVERWGATVERTHFVVFGNPNEAATATLDTIGAVYMKPIGGFAR